MCSEARDINNMLTRSKIFIGRPTNLLRTFSSTSRVDKLKETLKSPVDHSTPAQPQPAAAAADHQNIDISQIKGTFGKIKHLAKRYGPIVTVSYAALYIGPFAAMYGTLHFTGMRYDPRPSDNLTSI